MKTLESIIEKIYSNLDVEEVDKKPGSDLYNLVRAVAKAQYDSLQDIEKLKGDLFIEQAANSQLDSWGALVGIVRKEGSFSKGFVLAVSNQDKVIPFDTVLTDLKTGNQFLVTETTRLSRFIEKKIPIEAVERSPIFNLRAGESLFAGNPIDNVPSDNVNLEDVFFQVGEFRTTSGEICGDLKGGSFPESDDRFRERIKSLLSSSIKSNSLQSVKSRIISEPTVNWVNITSPLPSIIFIYVELSVALNQNLLEYFQSILDTIIPVGISYKIKEVEPVFINITVNVVTKESTDINKLLSDIRKVVYSYFYSLEINKDLSLNSLNFLIKELPLVFDASVSASDLPSSFTVIRPNNIIISYEFSN